MHKLTLATVAGLAMLSVFGRIAVADPTQHETLTGTTQVLSGMQAFDMASGSTQSFPISFGNYAFSSPPLVVFSLADVRYLDAGAEVDVDFGSIRSTDTGASVSVHVGNCSVNHGICHVGLSWIAIGH